jgi:hypothetical protein
VGRVAAWVCCSQALPTISNPQRWPCGPCGGMGLPCAALPTISNPRRWPCGPCGGVGLPFAGPPHNLYPSEMALWAVWRHGSAVCRPSPQSLTLGDGLVGRVAAWVCRVQALPTISNPRRWPCGPCGGVGLLFAGPPHNLYPSEMALWAVWWHGSAVCRPSPQSLPIASEPGLVGPRVLHEHMVVCSPPTSLDTKVSRRSDRVGRWGLDGCIGNAFAPRSFCLGYGLLKHHWMPEIDSGLAPPCLFLASEDAL